VRDEAHRFAISCNRKLRTKRTLRSELSTIPGFGLALARKVLEDVRGTASPPQPGGGVVIG
jgi:excinuclease ABC subunit C